MAHKSRDKIWNDFVGWCKKRHLKPLPAHAWTIAAFLRWLDSQGHGDQAQGALRSISRSHLLCGMRSPHHHPMIERTLSSIERRKEAAPDRSNLFEARDFLQAPMVGKTDADEDVPDEDEVADFHPGEEETPTTKRLTMRNQPRLVSRRRYTAT